MNFKRIMTFRYMVILQYVVLKEKFEYLKCGVCFTVLPCSLRLLEKKYEVSAKVQKQEPLSVILFKIRMDYSYMNTYNVWESQTVSLSPSVHIVNNASVV